MRFALLLLPLFVLSACDSLTPSESAVVSGTVLVRSSGEPAAGLVVYLGSDPICLPVSRCAPAPSIGRPDGQSIVSPTGSFSIQYDRLRDNPSGFYVRCASNLPACDRNKAFMRFRSFADGDTLYVNS